MPRSVHLVSDPVSSSVGIEADLSQIYAIQNLVPQQK